MSFLLHLLSYFENSLILKIVCSFNKYYTTENASVIDREGRKVTTEKCCVVWDKVKILFILGRADDRCEAKLYLLVHCEAVMRW
jgi:hypothetical protein